MRLAVFICIAVLFLFTRCTEPCLTESHPIYVEKLPKTLYSLVKESHYDDTHKNYSNETYVSWFESRNLALDRDDIEMHYPQINGLENKAIEISVNELIKSDVFEQLEQAKYGWAEQPMYYHENYVIELQTEEILSIAYEGEVGHYTSMHSTHYFRGMTFDLRTGKTIKLSDIATIDEMLVKKIKESTNVTNWMLEDGLVSQERMLSVFQAQYPFETNDEYSAFNDEYKRDVIQRIDKNMADWMEQDGGYRMFYLKPESVVVCLPVAVAGGDYVLVELPR